MTKTIIVTGVNGFVGKHVVDTFVSDGFNVVGIGYSSKSPVALHDKLAAYISCDLLDATSVAKIDLSNVKAVIHLAGLSNVSESFQRALSYINDNAKIGYNLLEHALAQNFKGRIVIVSSGALYNPNQPLPLTENSLSLENSPYAVGKLTVEHIANYFRLRGLNTVIARPFNHIGPGQGKGFLVPDLYFQLTEAYSRGEDTIQVGNLTTCRDYTDVRDIARAYKMMILADQLNYSTYNICTGRSLAGTDILHLLQSSLRIDKITYSIDSSKIRPTDIPNIYGDSSRLREETGWTPQIPLEQTIADFVESIGS